jgi:nitrate reductase beta subunit
VFITLPADEYDVVKRTDDGDVFIDEEAMRQLRLALPGYHF